jgi:glycosyltransferase involved in cell wall biosynthesis
MKILHFITSINRGGAENNLMKLLRESKNNNTNHKHYVISFSIKNFYENEINDLGFKVFSFDLIKKHNLLFNLISIFRLIKKIQPTTSHCWMYHASLVGGILSKIAGVENIIWAIRHSSYKYFKTKFLTIVIINALGLLSKLIPNKILYCSTASKFFHEKKFYDKKKSIIIFNGYQKKQKININQKLNRSRIIYGVIGRYSPQKDYSTLIKTISDLNDNGKINDIEFYLYGRDINYFNKKLTDEINQYGLERKIILNDYHKDLTPVFENINFLISTSQYGESFPNVIAEAMLNGVPCISTNLGEAKNIIGNLGWIVPIKDVEQISNSIILSKENYINKEKYIYLSNSCNKFINTNYSLNEMFERYTKLWI